MWPADNANSSRIEKLSGWKRLPHAVVHLNSGGKPSSTCGFITTCQVCLNTPIAISSNESGIALVSRLVALTDGDEEDSLESDAEEELVDCSSPT